MFLEVPHDPLSRRPTAEAADDGAELLVVFGGDGTVHEVVNGIACREGVEPKRRP